MGVRQKTATPFCEQSLFCSECMLWLLAVLLMKHCTVTNPYYEAEVIFFFIRTYFIGEEKDFMVEVITEASVQVMQS